MYKHSQGLEPGGQLEQIHPVVRDGLELRITGICSLVPQSFDHAVSTNNAFNYGNLTINVAS